jgi:hypothetical protein
VPETKFFEFSLIESLGNLANLFKGYPFLIVFATGKHNIFGHVDWSHVGNNVLLNGW